MLYTFPRNRFLECQNFTAAVPILTAFILEISRLKRQKSFVVDLYQQKLNQIIDVENKLDNEINKWKICRK